MTVFSGIAIVAALATSVEYIELAKTTAVAGHLFLIIAWILCMLGFGDLDSECEADGDIQCSLRCDGATSTDEAKFSPFRLCDPWYACACAHLCAAHAADSAPLCCTGQRAARARENAQSLGQGTGGPGGQVPARRPATGARAQSPCCTTDPL